MAEPWLRPENVLRAVEDWTGVEADLIISDSRNPLVVRARKLCRASLEQGCGMTSYTVARFLQKSFNGTAYRLEPQDPDEVSAVINLARELQSAGY